MSLNYFDGTNLQNIAGAKTIEVDDVPTANSENPVSSGGVYSALNSVSSSGTGTRSSTYTSGTCNWFKMGKIVCVSIRDLGSEQYNPDRTLIFSGLPRSVSTSFTFTIWGTDNIPYAIDMVGNSTTIVQGGGGFPANIRVYGTGIYIAAE